jgi:hypothetical protein
MALDPRFLLTDLGATVAEADVRPHWATARAIGAPLPSADAVASWLNEHGFLIVRREQRYGDVVVARRAGEELTAILTGERRTRGRVDPPRFDVTWVDAPRPVSGTVPWDDRDWPIAFDAATVRLEAPEMLIVYGTGSDAVVDAYRDWAAEQAFSEGTYGLAAVEPDLRGGVQLADDRHVLRIDVRGATVVMSVERRLPE